MGDQSKIEWTDATWNPWHGCRKISAGCKNCYMFRDKERYGQDPTAVVRGKTTFTLPLRWTEPRMVFTCSWSDFFIEEADAWRDEAMAIMALTPEHTYQVLTKRPERMREYLCKHDVGLRWAKYIPDAALPTAILAVEWARTGLPNVWLGVSVEDQKAADERIRPLLDTPAAVRFLSIEPLLGEVSLRWGKWHDYYKPGWRDRGEVQNHLDSLRLLDWIIIGCESGPNRRPTQLEWVESLVEQCKEAGVAVFVKQLEIDGKVTGDIEKFPAHLRVREFPAERGDAGD